MDPLSRPPHRKVVGYAPGAWDLFHVGHLNIIRAAKARCDHLVVGVVTDEVLMAIKGKRPMFPLQERMEILEAIDLVDQVVVDEAHRKLDAWEKVRFDILFKGDDWKGTPKGDQLEADMASVGASVYYFPYTLGVSSTVLRDRLMAELRGELELGKTLPTPPEPPVTEAPRASATETPPGSPERPRRGPFKVLFLCAANQIRSPLAEYLLRQRAESAGLPWVVSSAGARAYERMPIHRQALEFLAERGIDASKFSSRQANRPLLEDQDLILTMTDEQRAWVVRHCPSALSRTFTLLPFSNLVSAIPPEDGTAAVDAGPALLGRASKARARVQPLLTDRNIADPMGMRGGAIQAAGEVIERALDALLRRVRPGEGKA